MADALDSLYNSAMGCVWRYFSQISAIPRPSKHEEKIRHYLLEVAQRKNWQIRRDRTGNIVFEIPGRGALVDAPILVLQGHMDMVCEKNSNIDHDFMTDSILLSTDGVWVSAVGTTLGADNGIALAMMLSIADSELPERMPLELLFTVDEETGLTGAMSLDKDIVHGRTLLNLDSEDDRVLTIGCAGGQDMMIYYPYQIANSISISHCHTVHIERLRGGHSGVNIHEGRGNAIIFAAKFLNKLREFSPELAVFEFRGGNKKNAIPREATFTVANCDSADLDNVLSDILVELRETEQEAEITIEPGPPGTVNGTIPDNLVEFLLSVPNGVIAMDPNFPTLVQTSCSVGVMNKKNDGVEVHIHGRSSSREALADLQDRIRRIANQSNGRFTVGAGFPGWNPNPNSKLLQRSKAIYKNLFGRDPHVVSMHAGLETGILGDILNTEELLSIGPTIENAHSPTERVRIDSVEMIFQFLKHLVADSDLALTVESDKTKGFA